MHSLITSYLLQSKECILPGIGTLEILHTPASVDAANNRILPPFQEFIFKNEHHSNSLDLAKYIAGKKHIALHEAEAELINFCNEWKDRIKDGEKLHFETVGAIYQDTNGKIIFEKEDTFNFFQPVAVDTIYHQSEMATPAVEEKVTPEPAAVTEEVVVERSNWGLWAIILLAVGFVILFLHFKDDKLSGSSIGNKNKFVIDSSGSTYQVPK